MRGVAPFLLVSMFTHIWSFRLVSPFSFQTRSLSGLRGALFANSRVSFGNLPFDVTEEELHDIVSKSAGTNFKSLKFANNRKTGRFGGLAFIDYDSVEEAASAVEALSTLVVHERVANVAIANATSGEETMKPRRGSPDHTCFVANLDPLTTEDDIRSLCEKLVGVNSVKRITVLCDFETGRPRGFGYIQFKDAKNVVKALETIQGAILHDREIFVDVARKEGSADGSTRTGGRPVPTGASVFIGNLGYEVDEDTLKDMLTDVVGEGAFQSIKLALDRETGRPRGFAHVQFPDLASAQRAVQELDGLEMMDRLIRVDLTDGPGRKGRADGARGDGMGGGRKGFDRTTNQRESGPSFYGE